MCGDVVKSIMIKDDQTIKLKCAVIGDENVGKTELIYSLIEETQKIDNSTNSKDVSKIKKSYVKTYVDNLKIVYTADNVKFILNIVDNGGSDKYERIRTLSYPLSDVFILCFALNNIHSFKNITEKWIPEISSYKTPVIIVGCKSDIASNDDGNENKFNDVYIEKVLNSYLKDSKYKYLKCSAYESNNVSKLLKIIINMKEKHDRDRLASLKKKKVTILKKIIDFFLCRVNINNY